MTDTPVTLNSIDTKLEYIVSIMVRISEENAQFSRDFRTQMQESNERMARIEQSIAESRAASNEWMARIEQSIAESHQRMARMEQSIAESNDRISRIEQSIAESRAESNERLKRIELITESQARVAEQQAESVRMLIQMFNQRGA